jgi:hypothetical protein
VENSKVDFLKHAHCLQSSIIFQLLHVYRMNYEKYGMLTQ